MASAKARLHRLALCPQPAAGFLRDCTQTAPILRTDALRDRVRCWVSVPFEDGDATASPSCCTKVTPRHELLFVPLPARNRRVRGYSHLVKYDNSALGGVASTPPTRPFFQNKRERFRMETKEIAMQKRTTMMGTACVLAAAALTAGPAAADTLTGFAGVLNTNFESTDNSAAGSDTIKSWLLGGSAAMPLSDIP